MPQYYYKAINQDGEAVEGTIQAFSLQMARAKLSQKKLQVDTLMLDTETSAKPEESLETNTSPEDTGQAEPAKNSNKMLSLTMVEISERIADLTTSRLPLTTGLLAVAENHPDKQFKNSALSIVKDLEKGQSLDSVLSQHGFSGDYLAIIKAGLYSNNVEKTIQKYLREQNQTQIIIGRFLKAFYYPVALLSFTFLVLFFFLYWVVPQFASMYLDFGTSLPYLTSIIVDLSGLISDHAIVIFILLICTIAGMIFLLSRAIKPGIVNNFMRVIPFWGRIFRTPALCRFCYALSAFIDHQISLPESFRLAGEASKDNKISFQANFIANKIEKGTPAHSAVSGIALFPPLFQQVFQWEQHPKFMTDALKSVGEMEEIQAEGRIGVIIPLIEPLALIFLGGTSITLVFSLFIPLIQLIGMLS
jgi:type IV pilus assembly protein PilC